MNARDVGMAVAKRADWRDKLYGKALRKMTPDQFGMLYAGVLAAGGGILGLLAARIAARKRRRTIYDHLAGGMLGSAAGFAAGMRHRRPSDVFAVDKSNLAGRDLARNQLGIFVSASDKLMKRPLNMSELQAARDWRQGGKNYMRSRVNMYGSPEEGWRALLFGNSRHVMDAAAADAMALP
jgi:hypothetical protein